MQYCKLGRTDLEVSTVCCGTMAMSSRGTFGEQDDEASVRTVHAALEAGINFFDTAEGYGPGHSEEVLGQALEGRRDEVIIATKVGRNNLPEPALFAACEKSLKRLRTDRIDLYQVHWANHGIPFSETAAALEKLRERGKIRHWGVSNFGKLDMTEALDAGVGRPEVNQLPYSLLWRVVEHEISPICAENGVSIICYSPMAQGLLTGKFADASEVPTERARARYCVGSNAELAFGVIRELRAVSEEIGQPMADVALAWLLVQKGVACVIAGMRTPEQARENARAAELKLSAAVVRRLTAASKALKDALGTNPDMWNEDERSRYR